MLQSKTQRKLISVFLFILFSTIVTIFVIDSPSSPITILGCITGIALGLVACQWFVNEWSRDQILQTQNSSAEKYKIAIICSILGIALSGVIQSIFSGTLVTFIIIAFAMGVVIISGWSFFYHPPDMPN
nr:hypothetical protein [Oscillochloris trichoides]